MLPVVSFDVFALEGTRGSFAPKAAIRTRGALSDVETCISSQRTQLEIQFSDLCSQFELEIGRPLLGATNKKAQLVTFQHVTRNEEVHASIDDHTHPHVCSDWRQHSRYTRERAQVHRGASGNRGDEALPQIRLSSIVQ